jgi:hypothetical protein
MNCGSGDVRSLEIVFWWNDSRRKLKDRTVFS